MNLSLGLLRAAQREYDEAGDWYEARRPGRGAAFTAAVQRVFDGICAHPDRYPVEIGDVRAAPVRRPYPYCVYNRVEATRILVISVFHTSRDPTVWQSRVV